MYFKMLANFQLQHFANPSQYCKLWSQNIFCPERESWCVLAKCCWKFVNSSTYVYMLTFQITLKQSGKCLASLKFYCPNRYNRTVLMIISCRYCIPFMHIIAYLWLCYFMIVNFLVMNRLTKDLLSRTRLNSHLLFTTSQVIYWNY